MTGGRLWRGFFASVIVLAAAACSGPVDDGVRDDVSWPWVMESSAASVSATDFHVAVSFEFGDDIDDGQDRVFEVYDVDGSSQGVKVFESSADGWTCAAGLVTDAEGRDWWASVRVDAEDSVAVGETVVLSRVDGGDEFFVDGVTVAESGVGADRFVCRSHYGEGLLGISQEVYGFGDGRLALVGGYVVDFAERTADPVEGNERHFGDSTERIRVPSLVAAGSAVLVQDTDIGPDNDEPFVLWSALTGESAVPEVEGVSDRAGHLFFDEPLGGRESAVRVGPVSLSDEYGARHGVEGVSADTAVVALDFDSGAVVWRMDSAGYARVQAVDVSGRHLVVSGDFDFSGEREQVMVDADTGEVLWSSEVSFNASVVTGSQVTAVYGLGDDASTGLLDADTGEVLGLSADASQWWVWAGRGYVYAPVDGGVDPRALAPGVWAEESIGQWDVAKVVRDTAS